MKLGKVITITSGKGGVGKTTLTANLSAALASIGRKVVAIDTDIGLRNLDVVMGLENRIVYDLVDVIEGRCRLKQAMIKDKRVNSLYMIPAAQTRDKMSISPTDMVLVCDQLREEMDYILIDSPAGIERGFQNALAPSDQVLIVTNPEVSAVRDADRIIGLVDAAEKGPAQLLVNRLKPEMVARGDMLSINDIVEILAVDVLGIIPEDESILISSNRGTPLTLDNGHMPRARIAVQNVARRIEGESVPFIDLTAREGLLSKVKGWFGG
ncbi:MAG: septum site-determining protein MinD [Ardenticatenaceae bacterium]|nr:septum site-determining protein MinD [Ardenticatenaceae bacterium]